MSDDKLQSKTLTVERRRVERRNTYDDLGRPVKLYFVVERQGVAWLTISKGYAHSTSAYAKLGRITSRQSEA